MGFPRFSEVFRGLPECLPSSSEGFASLPKTFSRSSEGFASIFKVFQTFSEGIPKVVRALPKSGFRGSKENPKKSMIFLPKQAPRPRTGRARRGKVHCMHAGHPHACNGGALGRSSLDDFFLSGLSSRKNEESGRPAGLPAGLPACRPACRPVGQCRIGRGSFSGTHTTRREELARPLHVVG